MDLESLLRRPEGKTLEFKRDLSSPDGIAKTLVAFANTSGGTVVIGVEDASRAVVGVADPLADEERLASLVTDRIAPTLVPDIEIVPWRRKHVLVAHAPASPVRPHRVARLGEPGGVFVRVGSTNRRADEQLVEELRRYVRNESYDEQPIPELDPEAIDFRAASGSFEGRRRLLRRDLATLGLTTRYQGRTVPTVGGILLFGRERAARFPDAYVRVGRFAGSDRKAILDSRDARDDLPQAAEEAIAFVERTTATAMAIEGARHIPQPTYPVVAVREAVINAVVHADYAQRGTPIRVSVFDGRLEVENPGLLPFGLTIEDLLTGVSKLRNRVIGRVFRELGLIEQWGSGIQRMHSACEEAGLEAPILEEIGTGFRVTIHAARARRPRLNETEQSVVEILREAPRGLQTSAIARALGRSDRATRDRLNTLLERGLVTRVGAGPFDPKARWTLPDRQRGG